MKQWAGWMLCAIAIGCGGADSGPSVASPHGDTKQTEGCDAVAHEAQELGSSDGVREGPSPGSGDPAFVAPDLVEARRVSGHRNVLPDEHTYRAMLGTGVDQVVAKIKLCLDETGAPKVAKIVQSSCFQAYDTQLVTAVATWRYLPFIKDGASEAVCTGIVFVLKFR